MSDQWVGCVVVVECGDILGTYRGKIVSVDSERQQIVLSQATRNGVKCHVPQVTICAQDIVDLNIIKACDGGPTEEQSASPVNFHDVNGSRKDTKKKGSLTPKKAEVARRVAAMRGRDEACFNAPVDMSLLEHDFDFEKNLALFDKRAVFNEIDAALSSHHTPCATERPAPVPAHPLAAVMRAAPARFKCDENVLGGGGLESVQHIRVPCSQEIDYVTDTGLLVPSISLELRARILEGASRCGYGLERQLEMLGRAASEMVLQLLGGCRRLNPRNSHQRPTLAVVCGSHRQGTQVVCCGRQLANHGVNVLLFRLPDAPGAVADPLLLAELALFQSSGGRLRQNLSELAGCTVDMVLSGLDPVDGSRGVDPRSAALVADWVQQSKAPVVSVDPPPRGGTASALLTPQWVLMPVLPLPVEPRVAAAAGLYLCDVGVPRKVFKDAGVEYASPFGSKFVVALHAKGK
uniref:Enhancer of mRNA-decapping protein 3 n=1 Tax=Ixodes ricinus TaxID=34613 RepID=A0A147BGB1_IXORI